MRARIHRMLGPSPQIIVTHKFLNSDAQKCPKRKVVLSWQLLDVLDTGVGEAATATTGLLLITRIVDYFTLVAKAADVVHQQRVYSRTDFNILESNKGGLLIPWRYYIWTHQE